MTEARRAFLLDELQRIKRLAEQDGAIKIAANIGQLWLTMRDRDAGATEIAVMLEPPGCPEAGVGVVGPIGSRIVIEVRGTGRTA